MKSTVQTSQVFNQVSTLTAIILFAIIAAQYINLPTRLIDLNAGGINYEVTLNVNVVITLLVAGMSASGVDWLIRSHPSLKGKSTIQHWVLPGLTAWVLGLLLNTLSQNGLWWVVFVVGASLLALVLTAEFIVVDASDLRYPFASTGLTALSFAIFLILAILLHASNVRLFLILPAIIFTQGAIVMRTIYLKLKREQIFSAGNAATAGLAALTSAIILGQLSSVLHYLPTSSISYGMWLLGPAYALTIWFIRLSEGRTPKRALLEPLIILTAIWGVALWTV